MKVWQNKCRDRKSHRYLLVTIPVYSPRALFAAWPIRPTMVFFSCCKPEKRDTMLALEDMISTDNRILDAGLSATSKQESRILRQAAPVQLSVDTQRSPRSLFEASAFRIASHQERARQEMNKPEKDDHGLPSKFLDNYVKALVDSNDQWASVPDVSDMFADDVKMTGQDKKTTEGKVQVIRRLNKGIAMLVQMAGKDAEVPQWDIEGPMYDEDTYGHQIRVILKRGLHKIQFQLEFFIVKGKIASFSNTRM
jgi:hypothetical protein